MRFPERPIIYEINTWVWLNELKRKHGVPITLASVPEEEWDAIAALGFDAVWLMGVWERSPASIRIAMENESLVTSFHQALPDFIETDNVGSPYSIRRYEVDPQLGGPAGLATARSRLAARGVGLILDFVPNHVARDHPWVADHPEYFVQGSPQDLALDPTPFVEAGGTILACGRDPFFPAWMDVLQLNAFEAGLRQASCETLLAIASQCDGVRCDMAMLFLNSVFERTWGLRAGVRPAAEFLPAILASVKDRYPDFKFIAEVYWDLEKELQQQGFDYCYDKRLYDRLEKDSAESVRLHLLADRDYQERLLRFIENHDEPRAAAVFPPDRLRAAAVAALSLPGAKLLHDGQLEGRQVRLPVFLGRGPVEAPAPDLKAFYLKLLKAVGSDALRTGEWSLCHCQGWPDNPSHRELAAWCWWLGEDKRLVVVNLSGSPSQGLVRLTWIDLGGKGVLLEDLFSGVCYGRQGDELVQTGLFVDLPGWGFHFFSVRI
jgi:Alpha amylase, catalytic domain